MRGMVASEARSVGLLPLQGWASRRAASPLRHMGSMASKRHAVSLGSPDEKTLAMSGVHQPSRCHRSLPRRRASSVKASQARGPEFTRPPPPYSTGRRAVEITAAARSSELRGGTATEGAKRLRAAGAARPLSGASCTSLDTSSRTGPGRPAAAMARALRTAPGISSALNGRRFVADQHVSQATGSISRSCGSCCKTHGARCKASVRRSGCRRPVAGATSRGCKRKA